MGENGEKLVKLLKNPPLGGFLDFDILLPRGRGNLLLVLRRATKPFDTHVSDFLLNVFRSDDL